MKRWSVAVLFLLLTLPVAAISGGSTTGNMEFKGGNIVQNGGSGTYISKIFEHETDGFYLDANDLSNTTNITIALQSSTDTFFHIEEEREVEYRPGKERYKLEESLTGEYSRVIVNVEGPGTLREVRTLKPNPLQNTARSYWRQLLIFITSVVAGAGVYRYGSRMKRVIGTGSEGGHGKNLLFLTLAAFLILPVAAGQTVNYDIADGTTTPEINATVTNAETSTTYRFQYLNGTTGTPSWVTLEQFSTNPDGKAKWSEEWNARYATINDNTGQFNFTLRNPAGSRVWNDSFEYGLHITNFLVYEDLFEDNALFHDGQSYEVEVENAIASSKVFIKDITAEPIIRCGLNNAADNGPNQQFSCNAWTNITSQNQKVTWNRSYTSAEFRELRMGVELEDGTELDLWTHPTQDTFGKESLVEDQTFEVKYNNSESKYQIWNITGGANEFLGQSGVRPEQNFGFRSFAEFCGSTDCNFASPDVYHEWKSYNYENIQSPNPISPYTTDPEVGTASWNKFTKSQSGTTSTEFTVFGTTFDFLENVPFSHEISVAITGSGALNWWHLWYEPARVLPLISPKDGFTTSKSKKVFRFNYTIPEQYEVGKLSLQIRPEGKTYTSNAAVIQPITVSGNDGNPITNNNCVLLFGIVDNTCTEEGELIQQADIPSTGTWYWRVYYNNTQASNKDIEGAVFKSTERKIEVTSGFFDINAVSPVDGATVTSLKPEFAVEATTEEPGQATLYINNSARKTWTFSGTSDTRLLTFTPKNGLSEGLHKWNATYETDTRDTASTETRELTIDTSLENAYNFTLYSPKDGDNIKETETLTFDYLIEAANGGTLKAWWGAVGSNDIKTVGEDDTGTGEYNTTATLFDPPVGSQKWYVTHNVTGGGPYLQSQVNTFTVGEDVTLTATAPNQSATLSTVPVVFSGDVDTNVDGQVVLYIDGEARDSKDVAANTSKSFEFEVDRDLSEGKHTWMFKYRLVNTLLESNVAASTPTREFTLQQGAGEGGTRAANDSGTLGSRAIGVWGPIFGLDATESITFTAAITTAGIGAAVGATAGAAAAIVAMLIVYITLTFLGWFPAWTTWPIVIISGAILTRWVITFTSDAGGG